MKFRVEKCGAMLLMWLVAATSDGQMVVKNTLDAGGADFALGQPQFTVIRLDDHSQYSYGVVRATSPVTGELDQLSFSLWATEEAFMSPYFPMRTFMFGAAEAAIFGDPPVPYLFWFATDFHFGNVLETNGAYQRRTCWVNPRTDSVSPIHFQVLAGQTFFWGFAPNTWTVGDSVIQMAFANNGLLPVGTLSDGWNRKINGLGHSSGYFSEGGYFGYPSGIALAAKTSIYQSTTVSGSIDFSDLDSSASPPTSSTIDFEDAPGHIAVSRPAMLDSEGNFSVPAPDVAGQYLVSIKHAHWLRRTVGPYDTSSNVTNVQLSLINGDCDGDNEVTLVDYGQLSASFGKATGDSGFNPNADLDGDDEVTLVDASILAAHFGQAGDE